jgi:hypothetical protein
MSVQKFQASVDIYDNGYCELYLNFDWASAPLNLDPLKPDLDGARRLAQEKAALLGWKESWVKRVTPQALSVSVVVGNRE